MHDAIFFANIRHMSLAPHLSKLGGSATAPVEIDVTQLAALGLTPRECEIMRWISEGKRNSEIGIILGVSTRTVEKHVGHILAKLEVETRTAAVSQCRYAIAFSGKQARP